MGPKTAISHGDRPEPPGGSLSLTLGSGEPSQSWPCPKCPVQKRSLAAVGGSCIGAALSPRYLSFSCPIQAGLLCSGRPEMQVQTQHRAYRGETTAKESVIHQVLEHSPPLALRALFSGQEVALIPFSRYQKGNMVLLFRPVLSPSQGSSFSQYSCPASAPSWVHWPVLDDPV